MKLNSKHITYLALAIFLILKLPVLGQEVDSLQSGEVEDAEILILKDRKLTLPRLEKIYEKSRIHDNIITPELRPNIFKPFSYKLQKSVQKISAAKPEFTDNSVLYNNYIKVGFGNYASPLLKAGFAYPVNDNKVFGLNLNHLSFGKGAVDDENSASSLSSAGAYGKIIGKKVAFTTALNFKSQTEYFYGYKESVLVDRLNIKQKFSFFDALISVDDANEKDEWNYELTLQYKNVSDDYKASENGFEVVSHMSYNDKISVDFELQTSSYTDTESINRNYFRAQPYYTLAIGEGQLDVGLSYSLQNDTTSLLPSSKVFPYLSAQYSFSDNFEAFASLDGGYNYHSYWSHVSQNPYLNSKLLIQNEEVDYEFQIGLRGVVSDNLSYEILLGNQSINGKNNYVNNALDSSRFDIQYLSTPTSISTFKTNLNYQLTEKHQFNLNYTLTNYSNTLDVLHLPKHKFELSAQHQLSTKFKIDWNFYSLSGIEVNKTIGVQETLSIQNLKLGIDYSVNDMLNAFAELDNMLNKNYERYLNYMQRGTQIKLGLFYKF